MTIQIDHYECIDGSCCRRTTVGKNMDGEEDYGVEGGRGEGELDEDEDDGCRGDVDGQRPFHLFLFWMEYYWRSG